MSQRIEYLEVPIDVELKVKVTIKSFSNHDGFFNGQIEKAIEEFKQEIKKELLYRITDEHQQQDFLQTVDYVTFEVEEIK